MSALIRDLMKPAPPTATGSILPSRIGRALLVACWLAVVYGTAAVVPHLALARATAAWIGTVAFLGSFTLVVERPTGNAGVLFSISGLGAIVMEFVAPSNGALVAIIATVALIGTRLDAATSRLPAILCSAGFLLAGVTSSHALSGAEVFASVPALLFTYLGSSAARRLREEQQRAEALLAEAIAGRDAQVRAAALDERAHLAREMHDVLAHALSALSIQLEGTRLLAEQRSCDPTVVTALDRAGRLAREGLSEARRAVGSLRGETLPGPDLLPQLADEFQHDTGVDCRLHVEGEPANPGAEARLALYRICQEALTNVRKHADASAVSIALEYRPEGIKLIVENDGVPLATPLPGGGYGLSGMRERAELLGGILEAGPTQRGFRVCTWIPTHPSDRSAS
ncbi:MAG TPA: sensor histidine kinase [Chloroflexota bacterium]|nr:sensor histidine kinase [Chloroflexota bacterium]